MVPPSPSGTSRPIQVTGPNGTVYTIVSGYASAGWWMTVTWGGGYSLVTLLAGLAADLLRSTGAVIDYEQRGVRFTPN